MHADGAILGAAIRTLDDERPAATGCWSPSATLRTFGFATVELFDLKPNNSTLAGLLRARHAARG